LCYKILLVADTLQNEKEVRDWPVDQLARFTHRKEEGDEEQNLIKQYKEVKEEKRAHKDAEDKEIKL
jgi:hypothetical protein